MIGTYVVDDEANVRNIESTGADTGGHHNIPDTIFKVLDESFAINLILASVKNDSFVAYFEQLFE